MLNHSLLILKISRHSLKVDSGVSKLVFSSLSVEIEKIGDAVTVDFQNYYTTIYTHVKPQMVSSKLNERYRVLS